MNETCTDCYKAIPDEELVWSDGFRDENDIMTGKAPYHKSCFVTMRTAFVKDFTIHQKKVSEERTAREHPEEELLTRARSYYASQENPQGDHAAAQWLIAKRNVKTDRLGHIFVYDDVEGFYKTEGETMLKAELVNAFGTKANRTRVGEVLARVQALSYSDQNILEQTTPANLIPFKNGIYDLKSDKLLNFSPDYFFIYKHPVFFDKEAQCPLVQKFLGEIVANGHDAEILIDIAALCLYRERVTPHFYVLVGNGRNGKSLYLNIVKELLGKQRIVSINPQALAEDVFAPAQLYNKHANLGADIPGGLIKDVAIVKSATGGDTINVQRKGVDREEREVYCEFIWASNDPPRINEDTRAIWERLVVIVFPFTFIEKPQGTEKQAIKGLDRQLIEATELSGFLNLLLVRLPQLIKKRSLSSVVSAEATRKQYRILSDTPAVFAEECCEEVEYEPYNQPVPSSGYTLASEAYRSYRDWCKNEIGTTPVSPNRFGRSMEKLGFEHGKDQQQHSYRGLKLKWGVGPKVPIHPILPACDQVVEDRIGEIGANGLIGPTEISYGLRDWMAWLDQQNGGTAAVDDFLANFPNVDYQALRVNGEVYEPRPGFVRRII